MSFSVVVCAAILLSLVCVEGTLRYAKTKSGWNNFGDPYKKQLERLQAFHNSDLESKTLESGKIRNKRDGHVPVSSTPYTFNGDHHRYANVHYSGEDSDVVFVLTYSLNSGGGVTSSSLYRSSDYGKTFTDESNKFPSGFKLHPYYHISPDKNILIIPDDNQKKIYISTDEGRSYTPRLVPVDQTSLLIHPTQNGLMLGLDDSHNLKVSLDLGNNWNLVSSNVRSSNDYTWGTPGVDWDLKAANKSAHSVVYYNTYDASQDPNADDVDVSLFVSQYPFGEGSSRVFDSNLGLHDAFLIDDRYIFVQRTVNEQNNEVELLVSYDRQPFNVAQIPFEESHLDYYVFSYRSAQAVVIVKHSSAVNNLYLSDETGTYYSLSLDNIVIENGYLDLELVSSMNGTLVANQFFNGQANSRTKITYNNGAEWHLLEAPEITLSNDETNCELPHCSLHFHMSSSQYSRLGVYSRSSAPGIIIAHGNYGPNLADNPDLYISRDGGIRWEQTLSSSWDAQIIDHGGLLVAAKDYHQEDDTAIKYSCNEGISWKDFTFTTTTTVIWGVVTEPGETTTEVTLFGSEDRSSPEWAVISVNFSAVFQGVCQDTDYWDWAVTDGRIEGQNCLLGEARVIERRKVDVCCLSGEKYERTLSSSPCECVAEDFECDWGYRRDEFNEARCVIDYSFESSHAPSPCSIGYRKIAGDTCVNGAIRAYLPCANTNTNDSNTGCSNNNNNNGGTNTNNGGTNTNNGGTSNTNNGGTSNTNNGNTNNGNTGTTGNSKSGDDNNDDNNDAIVAVLTVTVLVCVVVIAGLLVLVVILLRRKGAVSRGDYQRVNNNDSPPIMHFRSTDDDDDDALLRP